MAEDERSQSDAARAATGFAGPIPHAGEALRRMDRHGDYSSIVLRRNLGIPLTQAERDAIDRLERGVARKRGPKDPTTAFESVVCYRWLVERDGLRASAACAGLAAMMGTTVGAMKERLKRAKGLGENIACLTFDIHTGRNVPPALLRNRTPAWHCTACLRVRCKCDPAPRPAFPDTFEGATVTALLSFWSGR